MMELFCECLFILSLKCNKLVWELDKDWNLSVVKIDKRGTTAQRCCHNNGPHCYLWLPAWSTSTPVWFGFVEAQPEICRTNVSWFLLTFLTSYFALRQQSPTLWYIPTGRTYPCNVEQLMVFFLAVVMTPRMTKRRAQGIKYIANDVMHYAAAAAEYISIGANKTAYDKNQQTMNMSYNYLLRTHHSCGAAIPFKAPFVFWSISTNICSLCLSLTAAAGLRARVSDTLRQPVGLLSV